MRKFDLSLRSSRSSYFATFRHQLRFCQKLTRWMRRSGLICLARSSRTGLDMSHILFMVERSEERFSRNAETDLVCRLLLEKKNFVLHAQVRKLFAESLDALQGAEHL